MPRRSPPSSPSTPASRSSPRPGRRRPPRRAPLRAPPNRPRGSRATLDLKQIRSDPDSVRSALARRGAAEQIDNLLSLDQRYRELNTRIDEVRSEQNKLSGELKDAASAGKVDDPQFAELRDSSTALKQELKELEPTLSELEAERTELLASLPNIPEPEAPDGETEDDNVTVREVGERPDFSFDAVDHLDLGQQHGWIDMEAAARTSGSRFAYLMGDLVLLELALVRFALEQVRAEGFEPTIPPVLVREPALFGTGFFPGEREMIYEVPQDELFLVGTSEVSLASLHADQILEAADLPRRYAGFSTCFRREAGAAGRDTRGIFRVHQFDKVEMFSFVEPGSSREEHERILAIQERILQALEIPYRVVDIAVGDLGASAARKFDCEAWIPSQERFREVTSCSNTTDYQARRLSSRYRPARGEGPEPVHTLNGTAVAVGRTLIALLENGQREDRTVELPAALQDFGVPERIPTS
jgi:seryl-tRNA synthetase